MIFTAGPKLRIPTIQKKVLECLIKNYLKTPPAGILRLILSPKKNENTMNHSYRMYLAFEDVPKKRWHSKFQSGGISIKNIVIHQICEIYKYTVYI